jgi:hypothetical protein
MMEVIAVLMGVFFGVIISSASYVMGRINARKEMREVYNEAANHAESKQCDG